MKFQEKNLIFEVLNRPYNLAMINLSLWIKNCNLSSNA